MWEQVLFSLMWEQFSLMWEQFPLMWEQYSPIRAAFAERGGHQAMRKSVRSSLIGAVITDRGGHH